MYEDLAKQLRFCSSAATCEGCPYGFGGCEEKLMKDAAKAIEELDKKSPKLGKWTLNKDGSGTCSECGRKQYNCWDVDNWDNFCHFCGADMRPRPKEKS